MGDLHGRARLSAVAGPRPETEDVSDVQWTERGGGYGKQLGRHTEALTAITTCAGRLCRTRRSSPDYTGRNKPWSVMETEPPCQAAIIRDYAKWTALSALRSGAPIKSREAVYSVLDTLPFGSVFEGSVHIRAEESDAWHRESAEAMGIGEKR